MIYIFSRFSQLKLRNSQIIRQLKIHLHDMNFGMSVSKRISNNTFHQLLDLLCGASLKANRPDREHTRKCEKSGKCQLAKGKNQHNRSGSVFPSIDFLAFSFLHQITCSAGMNRFQLQLFVFLPSLSCQRKVLTLENCSQC